MKGLRGVLLVSVAAGCASGSTPFSPGDGDPGPQPDSPAEPPDARDDVPQPDAFVPPDAPPDAFIPPDAPPDAAIVAPDACVPIAVQHLANPSLDLAPNGVGWVDGRDPFVNMLPGGPFPMISADPTGVTAHSVPNKAWFGGASGEDVGTTSVVDQLHQDMTFPADATNFVVSGFILIGTNELGTTVFDTFQVDVLDTNGVLIENVFSANNVTIADVFTPFEKTLAANLAGRTVRLRILAINDITLHTNFFVDSLSVMATHCP